MKLIFLTLLATVSLALASAATTSEPSLSDIMEAQATTLPETPISNVKGLVFDRFYQVWLENIDYEDSEADGSQEFFAKQGILLINFYAVAHPSEPNYCAAAGGDTFGMDNDNLNQAPANVSTVADLLDTKSISWGEYQENLPSPGFQGYDYSNQQTYNPDYVRKHNPLFDNDLKNEKLPQWAFITPNMTNDAHDTNITFGASWEKEWLEPLLNNSYFMNNTVILLTYDEDKSYTKTNRIFSVLIGGGIPENLKGTKDNTFYTHYSTISTASANCFNNTYPGPFSDNTYSKFSHVWPNLTTEDNCSAGHGVLDIVKTTFNGTKPTYNYTYPFPWDGKSGYNLNVTASRQLDGKEVNMTSSKPKDSKSGAAVAAPPSSVAFTGALVAAFIHFL